MKHISQKHKIFSALIAIAFVISMPALAQVNIEGDVEVEMDDLGDDNLVISDEVDSFDEIKLSGGNVQFDGDWVNITQQDTTNNIDIDLTNYNPTDFEMFVFEIDGSSDTHDELTFDLGVNNVNLGEEDEEIIVGEEAPQGETLSNNEDTRAIETFEDFESEINFPSREVEETDFGNFEIKAIQGGILIQIEWEHTGEQATAFDLYRIEGDEFDDTTPTFEEVDDAESDWSLAGSATAGSTNTYEFIDPTPSDPDKEYCYTVVATSLGGVEGPEDHDCGTAFEGQLD